MPADAEARGVVGELAAFGPVELALRLTLLTLLLRPVGGPGVRPLVLAAAGAGLLLPGLGRRPALWLALAALTALRVALDWPMGDNHAYLLAYWCGALALALALPDRERCLRWNARALVGLAFAFAVLWKLVLSPDFRDGTFFRVTLIGDERVGRVAQAAAGLSADELAGLRARVTRHADVSIRQDGPAEPPPARLLRVADAAALWTIAIEGALALAFLWPGTGGPAALRDPLLLVFCATTFAVIPVYGFGWLLLAMGVAQAGGGARTRLAYAGVFGLLALYGALPWT